MWYLAFTLACSQNSTNEPSGKDVVMTVQKHASPKADDFATKSFECCDSKEARGLLDQQNSRHRRRAARALLL